MILNQAIMMISQAIMMTIHQSVTFRFQNFSNFLDSIGFSIKKIWYRKKYRIWYRKKFGIEKSIRDHWKYLVLKKVSDSLWEKIIKKILVLSV